MRVFLTIVIIWMSLNALYALWLIIAVIEEMRRRK